MIGSLERAGRLFRPWSRMGCRRTVAATAATASTATPAASSARCASRAVAPVVITSSQTTTCARRPDQPSYGARRAGHRARKVGVALVGVEPGLVGHAGSGAEQAGDGDLAVRGAEGPGGAAGHGEGRVVPAGPHRRGTRRHGHEEERSRGSGSGEHGRRQQLAERAGQPEQPPLLVADDHGAQGAVVRAGGEGTGQAGGGRRGPRLDGLGGQPGPAVRAEDPTGLAAPDAGRAEQQVGAGVEQGAERESPERRIPRPGRGQPRRRCLWTQPA